MNRLRLAIIGGGHLGHIHTKLASSIDEVELVAVVDPSAEARQRIESEFGIEVLADHRDVVDKIDAAIVAAPTQLHHSIGMDLLDHDVHLFVEKPLAISVEQAEQLVEKSEQKGLILQVGHVERFNPAFTAAEPKILNPKYFEATRTSGYTFRSTDIGVVLDLMIHDLDLVLTLAESRVVEVYALGISVLGMHEDMAQARLHFQNGAVANLTASRCNYSSQRTMQVFSESGHASIDFGENIAYVVQPNEKLLRREIDFLSMTADQKQFVRDNLFSEYLPIELLLVESRNAILEEQYDFVDTIQSGGAPVVDGRQALEVLTVAERILGKIAAHQWSGLDSGPAGPLFTPSPVILPGPYSTDASDSNLRKKAG